MRHLIGMRLDLLQQLQPFQLLQDSDPGHKPVQPGQALHKLRSFPDFLQASPGPWRSRIEGAGSPCRRPTSKSLKSWAGVIFTAPEPFSGSE